ncbi:MAG: hypothetical protein K0S41_2061 [Anaerocolumna sp.]|nr:hypothetical protein [Anaerocolumna sp.]
MTEYKVMFDKFKDKITDPDLLLYLEGVQQEILISLLTSACTKFKRLCKQNLADRDDTAKKFNFVVDDEVIDILSDIMVEYWLKPSLNNIENLRNQLSTKDFKVFSPADLLRAIQNTYNLSRQHAKSAMNEYSFINGDWENLKS